MSTSRLRVMVGALGVEGHALPAIALSRALHRRGHEVFLHTSARWRDVAEDLGLRFADDEERVVALPSDRRETPQPAVAAVARALAASLDELGPDVVVGDAFTLAPALAAELRGVPRATLLPEVYPVHEPGLPFVSLGLFPPRTRLGAAAWRAVGPALDGRLPTTRWLRGSRRELNAQRAELGLPPQEGLHGPVGVGGPTLVATFPQLEYPRRWPGDVHVTGPMIFDPPHPSPKLPEGPEPLVLVAPSTVKDRAGIFARLAVEALAGEPVRLAVATGGARPPAQAPPKAIVADWLDYSRVLAEASLVVTSGGHGALMRALARGVPIVIGPALPDDAERGARVAWTGAGLTVPRRLLGARSLRWAARQAIGEPRFAARAGAIAAWARDHDGAARGAWLVERHALASRTGGRGGP
jgi:UDP:flavonoid glycosyltransferase YjiC (YdhE family)